MTQAIAEWLAARRLGVGGSDAAAMLACHPYESLLSLWAKKTGRKKDDGDSVRLRWGRRFERAILDEYTHASGLQVEDQATAVPHCIADVGGVPMLRHPDVEIAIGNADGIVMDPARGPGVVDAKTVDGRMFSKWLKAGKPPLNYLVQVHHYMELTGLTWGCIAAFTGLNDPLYIYVIEHDPDFQSDLMDLEDRFWRNYVKRDQPPPADPSSASAKALREIYPKDNGRAIMLTGPAIEWAADFDDLTAQAAAIKAKREAAKTMLIATIGEAQAGILPDDTGFTFKTGTKNRALLRAGAKALKKYETTP